MFCSSKQRVGGGHRPSSASEEPMVGATAVIERCLTVLGGTAVALAVGAGGARLFSAAGAAMDDSMEGLFADPADRSRPSTEDAEAGR